MKKNLKTLLVAILVLAFLLGVFYILPELMPERKEEPLADFSETTGSSDSGYIINEKTDDVERITFSTGEITYSVINGEIPAIEGYISHIINEKDLYMALFNGTSIMSERIIEDPKELSSYGLENAEKYVSVKLKDGTEKIVYIGNPTNLSGEYYASSNVSDKVYVISANTAGPLLVHPEEYRNKEVAQISGETVSDFSISRGNAKLLDVKYISTSTVSGQNIHEHMLKYPYDGVKANADSIAIFCQSLSSVTATAIVEENPKNLAKYGLDKPYILTVTDENGTSVIKMGNYAENGEVYVMNGDVPVVYSAECSFYENVKNIKPDEFVDRFVHLFNISTVAKIEVRNSEESHSIEVIKKSEDKYDYKVDGKNKVKDNFTPIYTAIIGITANSFVNDATGGEEYCAIKIGFNDKTEKVFRYYSYDDRHCVVKADNGMGCIVTKKSIDEIFKLINTK